MCLGVPLKIISIEGKEAIGEFNGLKDRIRTDFISDLKIGDYVMVHAGFAIEKMDKSLAYETGKAILEVTENYNKMEE